MMKAKMKSSFTSTFFGIGALLTMTSCTLLSSCVMYQTPPPARSVEYGTYSCDGSMQFVAQFQDEGNKVAFMQDNRTRVLERGADGVYRDSAFSLTGSEKTPITVSEDGVEILRNCRPVTTQEQYYRKDEQYRLFDIHRDVD